MTSLSTGRPRLAVMQPYFFPALAYFQLVDAVDIFVFLDDAQFVTKRWTHRNRIVIGGRPLLVTVPLEKRSQNRSLDAIALGETYPRWRSKFVATLRHGYGRGERAKAQIDAIDHLLAGQQDDSIATLAERTVRAVAGDLGLDPLWYRSSMLDYDRSGDAEERIMAICRHFGARTYVNMPGGRLLYSSERFARGGIALRFIEPTADGIGLSILDTLLRPSGGDIYQQVEAYALVE